MLQDHISLNGKVNNIVALLKFTKNDYISEVRVVLELEFSDGKIVTLRKELMN